MADVTYSPASPGLEGTMRTMPGSQRQKVVFLHMILASLTQATPGVPQSKTKPAAWRTLN